MKPKRWRGRLALPRSILLKFGLIMALLVALRGNDVVLGRSDPASEARDQPAAAKPSQEPASPEKDGPLDPFFDLIDPSRFQKILDQAIADRSGRERPRRELPEVPEIGEPVFFDLSRPLGAQKYSNEFNYLLNPSTANAPTMQVLEYEYAFADWNTVEVDLAYFNQSLEILTPFYQRTLGVGRNGRTVRGIQISTDLYLRSGFVGGSAVYAFGWKPTKESRFSTLSFLGVNRTLIGGFLFPASPVGRMGLITSPSATTPATPDDKVYGAWRPTFNLNLFYKLTEKVSLGFENDLFFQSGRASEYFSFPFLTWEAGQHAFFQAGGGYYHFESRDQFTFLLHMNFVNPSVKVSKEQFAGQGDDPTGATAREEESGEGDSPRRGPIRQWLERRWSR